MQRYVVLGGFLATGVSAVIAGLIVASLFGVAAAPTVAYTVSAAPAGSAAQPESSLTTAAPAPMPDQASVHATSGVSLQVGVSGASAAAPAPAAPASVAAPTATEAPATARPASTPKPLVFANRIVDVPGTEACPSASEAMIRGVVKAQDGNGINGAVVQVSSADGRNVFTSTTDSQGSFEVSGLGCTMWIVRLVSLPAAPGGFEAGSVAVNVDDSRHSGFQIEFQQQ